MDRPPSFPNPNFFHRPPPPPPLNSNPNFFHRAPPPPLQTPNTYSNAPSPPPIRELSSTLSSLQSLLSECRRTLDSLSDNLAFKHSSLLHKDCFVRCPFDPNHLMPPEALFLHSLRCPKPLDLTHLLGSFSSYRNTLELPCEPEPNNGDGDLCFCLDDVTDFGNNFFYNDCPGAVNFSELDAKTLRFTLPSVLSVECCEFVGSPVLEKSLGLLPSDVCAIKREIGGWSDYPSFYSYSVLCSILGSEVVEMSELRTWILVNSTRYGVIIDTYMRDHVLLLFRLSMKAVVKEACGFMREYDHNAAGEQSCKSRTFQCPVVFRVLSWLASQLGVLYGEGNGKYFALDMLKHCIEVSASHIMLFRSPDSAGVLKDLDDANFSNEDVKTGKTLDSGQVISVSRVAAAVAALYERSMLEGKIRAIRYAQPLTRYQRVAEHGVLTAKAVEERKGRPSYRPIIDHDGLPRQRLSNEDMNKMKTREELLAEERDYKRRRMSYRGKKVKRTPRQVLSDMIEEFTEEVKLAGGIGCFEKGIPLHSSSSISKDHKEIDSEYNSVSTALTDASPRSYKQWKGENHADSEYSTDIRTNTDKRNRYEEYDSGSSERQQSHRSYKRSDRRDDEFKRTKRRSHERESYHQNHRSSHEKSSSDYKTKRDDRYDSRRSKEPRKQNSFEDRYNPLERDLS
ncbi:U11/U12 small nuclear ribonucleoprotein 48 kDa protein isoform X2 [Raphanus sativus]|uniref:U11/U12 small nuclear ribonucleoprotein 48 kDa protein isoform X2 n=1 Tax=Raphanus sativus TaxID=3726 RepID=A0A6J0NRK9_RAPSA|nr:U11/U12 small nuclear ribonucleoprotein 48 kDa protein isoform X2 [Raphanus sativus]